MKNMRIDESKAQAIAERCADLNLYDDDDFTPPESVPDFGNTEFWDWLQEMLRASARNALSILQDEVKDVLSSNIEIGNSVRHKLKLYNSSGNGEVQQLRENKAFVKWENAPSNWYHLDNLRKVDDE